MAEISIEKFLKKAEGSIYKLTILVARRAQELAEGAQPLIENSNREKPLTIALRELASGQLEKTTGKNSQRLILFIMAAQPSGKAVVCKTTIQRFDSARRLCIGEWLIGGRVAATTLAERQDVTEDKVVPALFVSSSDQQLINDITNSR